MFNVILLSNNYDDIILNSTRASYIYIYINSEHLQTLYFICHGGSALKVLISFFRTYTNHMSFMHIIRYAIASILIEVGWVYNSE